MTELNTRLLTEPDDHDVEAVEMISTGEGGNYVIDELRDASQYIEASIFLKEGLHYSPFEFHPSTKSQQKLYQYVNSFRHKLVEAIFAISLLSLIFFEKPALYALSKEITGSIELTCGIFFLYNLHLKAKIVGGWVSFLFPSKRRFQSNPGKRSSSQTAKNVVRLFIVLGVLTGALVSLIHTDRITPFALIRPLVVLDTVLFTGPRRVLRQIINSFWFVKWMMMLLLLFVLISAVLSYELFSHVNKRDQPPLERNFDTVENSFVNLFVLITTANYPDVMMDAFANSQGSPIFFIVYLIIGVYFLTNIFLAFVFDFYQTREKVKFKNVFLHRRRAVRLAYDYALSSREGGLTMRAFKEIFQQYESDVTAERIVLCFKALDLESDGRLTRDEFYRFYDVVNLNWQLDAFATLGADYQYLSGKYWPDWRKSLRSFVKGKWMEYTINIVILCNVAFIVTEASVNKNGSHNNVARFQVVFYALFLLEAALKIVGLGKDYFKDGWHRFDFLIITASTALLIVEETVGDTPVGVFATIVRAFRLARIFRAHPTFKKVTEVMAYIFPKMLRFFIALLCVYYFFAVIGMMLFGGKIPECSSLDAEPSVICQNLFKALGSYYDQEKGIGLHFQLMSFDNVLYSYNTLFHLMIINNWQVTMTGHQIALNSNFSRIYFFVYYLITVIVVSNIVVAFVLDAFQVLYDSRVSEDKDSENYKRQSEEVHLPRNVAAQFLPDDHAALQHNDIIFTALRKGTAIYEILFRDDIKDWIEEDNFASSVSTMESSS
eukprot:m.135708 g.135708  ORF g.135708 m.135708 type:complete len:776 (-) comp10155_c0_seq1:130-2457(-)